MRHKSLLSFFVLAVCSANDFGLAVLGSAILTHEACLAFFYDCVFKDLSKDMFYKGVCEVEYVPKLDKIGTQKVIDQFKASHSVVLICAQCHGHRVPQKGF